MKQIEMIEKYLEGKMTLTEKLAFEQHLRENEELRSAFLKLSSLIEGIEYAGRNEALQQLQQIEANIADESTSVKKKGVFHATRFSMAAAVVAVLVVMGSFFIINSGQTEPSALFESNFTPYMNNVNSMSRSAADEFDQRDLAFAAYDNYNFVEASKHFKALLTVEEDASLLLYGGNAELSLGDTKNAIAKLTNLFENYDDFDNQAAWYLSLAHLKENNAMDALGYMMFLMTSDNSYSEKAADLFASLDLVNIDPPRNGGYPLEKAVVYDVRQDEVFPDGVEEEVSLNLENLQSLSKGRFAQYGVLVADADGEPLYFVTDRKLNNLEVGSSVLVKRIPGKGRMAGLVIIIGVL